MHITLANGAKSYVFEVQSSDTIQSIKQKLSELIKVRSNNLLLLLNGAFLENAASVDDYEIEDDTTIAYEIKLCGPKPVDFDWSTLGITPAPKKVHRSGVKKVTSL